MSYCVVADVQAMNATRLTGNGGVGYTATSVPNTTQVQAFIDEIAGEIDSILGAAAVLTPVTAPGSFVAFLKRLNALGAAYQAEAAMFPESAGSVGGTPQAQRYYTQYMAGLASLKDRSGIDPTVATSGSSSAARSYLTDNPDNDPLTDGTTEGQQPVFAMSRFARDF